MPEWRMTTPMPFEAGWRADREQLPRSCEGRDHREAVELHDAGARVQNPVRHRIQRGPRLVEIHDVDRGVAWNCGCCRGGMIRYRDWASLVARRQREQRARRDEPPVHGVLGCRDTPENQQAICRLLIAENTTAAHGGSRCCGAGPVALAPRLLDVCLTAGSQSTGVPTGASHG